MKRSCLDTFVFLEDESQKIGAEYLATVNIAKKIAELNSSMGHPYKIYLERKTRLVATDCVPFFGKEPASNFLGYKNIRRRKQNTTRNGNVDIAVYDSTTRPFGTPFCVIELKGFDPSRTVVLKDLQRNAEFFHISCRTGASQLNFAFLAAMHSFPNSVSDEQIAKDLAKLNAKYKRWQAEVSIPPNVEYRVDVSTVSKGKDFSYPDDSDPEFKILEQHHHFAGVIVSYAKKSNNDCNSDADKVRLG